MRSSALIVLLLAAACKPTETVEGKVGHIELSVRGLPRAWENAEPARGGVGPVLGLEFVLTSSAEPNPWTKVVAYPPPSGQAYEFKGADAPQFAPGAKMRLHLVGHTDDGPYSVGRSGKLLIEDGKPTALSVVIGPKDGFASSARAPLKKRVNHTLTALADGRVLIVGGRDEHDAAVFAVAPELYDPATGEACTACLTGDLPADLEHHTASALASGDVLVAGGRTVAGTETGALYRFVAAELRFEKLPASMRARAGHVAIDDPTNDRVILAGGRRAGVVVGDSDVVLHPAAAADVSAGPALAVARAHAASARLETGDVLVCGGIGPAGVAVDSAEVFVPSESKFLAPKPTPGGSARPAMLTARVGHAAVTLADGAVLIVGGVDAAGQRVAAPEIFSALFDTPGGFLTVPEPVPATAGLTASRLENGDVLLVSGATTGAWGYRFTPGSNPDIPLAQGYRGSFAALKYLPATARNDHRAVTLPDGSVLLVGGLTSGALATDAADDQAVTGAAEAFIPCAVSDRACPGT